MTDKPNVVLLKPAKRETNKDLIVRVLSKYIERLESGEAPEPEWLVMFTATSRWGVGMETHGQYIGSLQMEIMDYYNSIDEWEGLDDSEE